RPFRVNAGAIHSYILMPNGSTKYLSEVRSGDRVLVASRDGARATAVGRVKIERRPLKLIRLKAGSIEGSITLQDAETIALLQPDGSPIPVTSIKPGDRILAHIPEHKARHFGRSVDEFIIEK
ncbi:MAG: 3-dehydroquinate synthase II, partial [Aigarchaeota archaeon]|nr:3-dehydroquinate synthase II [Aigarchaeota archaeon]